MIWIRSGSARHELFRNPPEFSAFHLPSKVRFGGPFFMYPGCREDFWSELGEISPRRSHTPIEKKGLSGAIGKNYGRRDNGSATTWFMGLYREKSSGGSSPPDFLFAMSRDGYRVGRPALCPLWALYESLIVIKADRHIIFLSKPVHIYQKSPRHFP